MNSAHLFISPQENATKIGWCSIDCVLPWLWFKDTPFILIKLISLGKSKQWVRILISWRRLSEILQHLSALKSCHAGCIFMVRSVKVCPPPPPPPSYFHIHVELMNTSWLLCILCTSGGRQVIEQSGSVKLHVCCRNSFLQICHQKPPESVWGQIRNWRLFSVQCS